MKHVFIIGSRGYHYNYGGWETFVSNLVDNYNDNDTTFYISEYTNEKHTKMRKISNNIFVFPIYTNKYKSATMFIYTIKSFKFFIDYIEKNNIDKSYIYILGLKLFNYLSIYKNKLKKINITTLVNLDGLEHKRNKWCYPIKKFFLISEKLMLNNCDIIICDAIGIKQYVSNKYPKLRNKTVHISYGSDNYNIDSSIEAEVLKEYNLKKDGYCLMVGRCVPENNYEFIIEEFMKSNIKKDLLIVTNLSNGKYYKELIKKTKCLTDTRISFVNGIYDRDKLAIIRKNAYLYIHGHSVGGTNPSLLESLCLTDLNVLYDVCFNRDIGKDSCFYFKNKGDLIKILNDKSIEKKRKSMGIKAKKIINESFTWNIVVDKYKSIFK